MRLRNPYAGLRGLPRDIWVLSAATFLNRAGTMVLPFLALYLTHERGYPAARAGLALTVYGLGSLVTAPLAGRLVDRIGAPRILKASLYLSGACLLVLQSMRNEIAILACVFVWAMVTEAFRPASLAIVTGAAPPGRRKAAFALQRLAVNAGMSIGPAAGGFLTAVSFRWLFIVDGCTALAAGLCLTAALRERSRAPVPPEPSVIEIPAVAGATTMPPHAAAVLARPAAAWRDARLVYFCVAMFPVAMVFFQSVGAMPLHIVGNLGISAAMYGLLLTLNTILILLLEVQLNTATAAWPHGRVLGLGALLSGVGFGALAFASTPFGLAVTVVVWTFGEMILFPGSAAYVAEIAPPERRGEYMGWFTMVFSLAVAVGPWLGTHVLETAGARVLWLGVLGAGALSAWLLGRVRGVAGAATAA